MTETDFYRQLVARNCKFISPKLQERIRRTNLLFVGCGLGSQIAVLATRTGFRKFILWDGDEVEIHNLNRQSFFVKDLGKNKAQTLSEQIRQVNPEVEIEVHSKFLEEEKDIRESIEKSDIVLNMADPTPTLYRINSVARLFDRPVLFPLNVGYRGFVLLFTPDSPTIEEFLGKKIYGPQLFQELFLKTTKKIPKYLQRLTQEIEQGRISLERFPQLGVTSYLNGAIIITTITKLLQKKKVPVFPKPIYSDLRK